MNNNNNVKQNLIARRMKTGELVTALPSHGIFKFSHIDDLESFCKRNNCDFKIVEASEAQEEEHLEQL